MAEQTVAELDVLIAELRPRLNAAVAMRRKLAWAEELYDVARVYRENVSHAPVEAVYTKLGYRTMATAVRRVQQARAAGFLSPTTPGRKGG